MGKKNKPLGIKTSRYFTKTCTKCSLEYPNWFTNCPNCGAAWDDAEVESIKEKKESFNKNIKIVVKITEEDFDIKIHRVILIFSADQGKSWYQMDMNNKIDHYMAEIDKVPNNSVIIYYFEVYLANGEKIVENNEEKFYYYKVGIAHEAVKEEPPKTYADKIIENIDRLTPTPQDYDNTPIEQTPQEQKRLLQENLTIFGKPQTQIDPNLRECPHCNSKIKNIWSVCPICGQNL